MTKTLKSPDNQMNWTDYSKSAVALFGLVYLCLVYLCLALALASRVPIFLKPLHPTAACRLAPSPHIFRPSSITGKSGPGLRR